MTIAEFFKNSDWHFILKISSTMSEGGRFWPRPYFSPPPPKLQIARPHPQIYRPCGIPDMFIQNSTYRYILLAHTAEEAYWPN